MDCWFFLFSVDTVTCMHAKHATQGFVVTSMVYLSTCEQAAREDKHTPLVPISTLVSSLSWCAYTHTSHPPVTHTLPSHPTLTALNRKLPSHSPFTLPHHTLPSHSPITPSPHTLPSHPHTLPSQLSPQNPARNGRTCKVALAPPKASQCSLVLQS